MIISIQFSLKLEFNSLIYNSIIVQSINQCILLVQTPFAISSFRLFCLHSKFLILYQQGKRKAPAAKATHNEDLDSDSDVIRCLKMNFSKFLSGLKIILGLQLTIISNPFEYMQKYSYLFSFQVFLITFVILYISISPKFDLKRFSWSHGIG